MKLRILGGQWKGRILHSPNRSPTRPTQGILRQAVFNICQHEIEGAEFLDLFAGSGAMGLEALSRGAKRAVFVEQDRFAAHCIRENIRLLGIDSSAKILMMDISKALLLLAKTNDAFDIIYIDPPYDQSSHTRAIVDQLNASHLIRPGHTLFIESASQNAEIDYSSEHLKTVSIRTFGVARLYQFVAATTE
jgi:16S rRNA (guanine966-N2)-methyltransferase